MSKVVRVIQFFGLQNWKHFSDCKVPQPHEKKACTIYSTVKAVVARLFWDPEVPKVTTYWLDLEASHNLRSIRSFLSSVSPCSTSMASCEDGECALLLIQNLRRSLAVSTSMPRDCALLQKYVSQASLKRTSSDSS